MHTPFFSIIIPTFNSEKTLQGALDSIFCQRFNDLEIIIVDGLSRDKTSTLIKENFRKDKRIRFVSESDKGIYDAMNKGIDMANGQWLYFLGSDDCFSDENVLQAVADSVQDCKCDFFYGDVMMNGVRYDGQFTFEKLLTKNISHQAIFFSKQLFLRIGKYNIRYELHADWEYNIRYFLQPGDKIKYKDILIANFGEGGVSSAHDVLFLRESLLPIKMQSLSDTPDYFKNIRNYDEWWRLIRNADIRSHQQLHLSVPGHEIPIAIQNMVTMQKFITLRLLRMGIVSKLIMTVSYIINLFTKDK